LKYAGRTLAKAISSKADIVVLKAAGGTYEPLFAVYRKSALEAINEVLQSGGHKISDVFSLCKVHYVELDDAEWLVNLNTMAEYEEYQKSQWRQ